MWKSVLEGKNLTNENKTPEQITDAAKEFRKLFIENSYLPRELVKEIKLVDSTNTHIPLEKQINMFPEAGEFFLPNLDFVLFYHFNARRLSYVQNSSDEQDKHGTL